MERNATVSPSGIIVQKYGGSSLADLDSIRRVATRVVESVSLGKRVVVVVSAMGNTTNELLALAHGMSSQPPTRELDMLVSVGERVSMALLAMAIQELGHPAVSFTGSQSGIITDRQHVAARVLEVRPARIQAALAEGKVVVVAGFQGVSTAREVTTLGRGGSDTTAVVLAAALGADYCEICSDVEGIYTSDPRHVPGAEKLNDMSLDSALALGRAGAKVLLAEAVERARDLGVKLHASSTWKSPGSGTDLAPGPVSFEVLAVACDLELEWAYVDSAESLTALTGAIRWSWMDSGRTVIVVDMRNLHGATDGLDSLSGIRSRGPVGCVSVVGEILVRQSEQTLKALDVIEDDWILHWSAIGDGLSVLVPREHAYEVQRRLHDLLIV